MYAMVIFGRGADVRGECPTFYELYVGRRQRGNLSRLAPLELSACAASSTRPTKRDPVAIQGRFVYLYCSLGRDDSYTTCGEVRAESTV